MVALLLPCGYRDVQPEVAQKGTVVEHGSIEKTISIDASPEVVYEVITSPEHIRGWWNGAETDVEAVPGSVGEIAWDRDGEHPHIENLTVVSAEPFSRFVFRWVYGPAPVATESNSLLVTFELQPEGDGTVLRMTESGFRERGWEAAVLEQAYADHVNGWDLFVPSIRDYAEALVAA
jgi:uncharacterized protein YndB with AHSA1/START domain